METILSVKNLNVAYDGKSALENISVEIPRNQITAVIGPSGCGKTTFLKTLNGFLNEEHSARVEGEILLRDKSIKSIPSDELRRRIGLVFQIPSPFPFSILKNMTYALKYYGNYNKAQMEEIAVEKLKLAGLYDEVKDDLNKSAVKLSGGQQQRLCIARALTVEPEILLLDEPCSALDVRSSAVIEDLLLKLKESYTIVVVTHNIQQAKRIADNVVFLYDGKLEEQGSEVFTAPKSEVTKAFLKGVFG